MSEDEKAFRELRVTAMNLLARREHSRVELARKLEGRGQSAVLVERVLGQLVDQGMQSDARFAEAFLRSRVRKGQGAYRIRQELRLRGVSDDCIDVAFAEESVDWFELALDVARRRFGGCGSVDRKERGRRIRFLQHRGFNSEQIQYALTEK